MIAVPLAHKYCEASLSFSRLKNADCAKADLLRMVRQEVLFDLFLCIIKTARHWSGWHISGCFSEKSLIEEKMIAKHLVSPSGKKAKNLTLDRMMIMPEDALEDNYPDHEELNEATGNDGVSMDRWYSQAALLLWPEQHRLEVLKSTRTNIDDDT